MISQNDFRLIILLMIIWQVLEVAIVILMDIYLGDRDDEE